MASSRSRTQEARGKTQDARDDKRVGEIGVCVVVNRVDGGAVVLGPVWC